jgi:hypothetical protein
VTPDNFDDWFKESGLPESMREHLMRAWEAGWDAGKLYERLTDWR